MYRTVHCDTGAEWQTGWHEQPATYVQFYISSKYLQYSPHQHRSTLAVRLEMGRLPTRRPRATQWTTGTLRAPVNSIQTGTIRANRGSPEVHRPQDLPTHEGHGARRNVIYSRRRENSRPNTECNISDAVRCRLIAY